LYFLQTGGIPLELATEGVAGANALGDVIVETTRNSQRHRAAVASPANPPGSANPAGTAGATDTARTVTASAPVDLHGGDTAFVPLDLAAIAVLTADALFDSPVRAPGDPASHNAAVALARSTARAAHAATATRRSTPCLIATGPSSDFVVVDEHATAAATDEEQRTQGRIDR
jgi:hypothetical protein